MMVVDWLANWCFILVRTNWHIGLSSTSIIWLTFSMWWVADLQARKLAKVSVLWFHLGAASAEGLKLLGCVDDQRGMDGTGGIRVVNVA